MKAIISTKHGSPDVLRFQEVAKPKPADGEVLVRIHAATVTQGDILLRKLHPLLALGMSPFGFKRKKTPGHEFAGVVEEIGIGVNKFKPGDRVFGTTTGLKSGSNAEFVCIPEKRKKGVMAEMPENASFSEAAALPVGGMTALEILEQAKIKPGDKVLVYGASGSVGTYAVQLARHYFGATVTGVCSTANIELVRSLGADKTIDYTREDFTGSGELYDVVFDAVGKISKSEGGRTLKENGTYLTVQSITKGSLKNLLILKDLLEKGKVKPVIDQQFPLDQTAEAHRYVETGRKKGNVVISVIQSSTRRNRMKAIVWTKYGPPEGLHLREVEMPTPKADEILVKIRAASVTAGDCEMRRMQLPLGLSFPFRMYAGAFKPKRIQILGQELAGEVVEVGNQVKKYQVGDQVFGTTGFGFGSYAEYICLPAQPDDAQGALTLKPSSITFEEAATVPTAGFEALHFLREAKVQTGRKVLIIGGGGSIGTLAIQLGKVFGAEVTGVDSTIKQEMMRSLGADHVIDYTKTDYTKSTEEYDLIIDVVGKHSVSRRLKLLKPDGIYFLAFARLPHILLARWTSSTSNRKLIIRSASQKENDLVYLAGLLEAGKLVSVIDRQFPLEKVADAHKYSEAGGKMGNIAISVQS